MHNPSSAVGPIQLGTVSAAEELRELGLPQIQDNAGSRQQPDEVPPTNPFASILPFLTALPLAADPTEKADAKPIRHLVAKGLPTLPTKLVERVWCLEYVDMEEFLPAPRSLRLAEQGKPTPSLQESLVGALNQFQAIQQQQRSQRWVLDVVTWTRCFTLYIAVMAKEKRT